MLKKILFSTILSIISPSIYAVNMLDTLNYFLHSTAPKYDRDYPYEQAMTIEECQAVYEKRIKKLNEFTVAACFLSVCVLSYMFYHAKGP
jgi:hypothetical protein